MSNNERRLAKRWKWKFYSVDDYINAHKHGIGFIIIYDKNNNKEKALVEFDEDIRPIQRRLPFNYLETNLVSQN